MLHGPRPAITVFYEHRCAMDSQVTKVAEEVGVEAVRVTLPKFDFS